MGKRNVDVESHLLTGGLITGFLTFMGFLPGAAASAAITGSLVGKDIKKAKKQEAFQRDFTAHQEKIKEPMKQADKTAKEIRELLSHLEDYEFDPNSPEFIEQELLESYFYGASIIQYKSNVSLGDRWVSVEKMFDIVKNAQKEDKSVILDEKTDPSSYRVKVGDEILFTNLPWYKRKPYNFRKQCKELDVPFKPYKYSELQTLINKKIYSLYEPYNFDFSKYQ